MGGNGGLEGSGLGTPLAASSFGKRDKIMRVIAAVVAVIGCGALVACFHHRQTVVEYAPPPLSTAPYK
jgi:predicted Na+-dependent transporter